MTALFPFSLYLVAIIYFIHVCVSVTNLCIKDKAMSWFKPLLQSVTKARQVRHLNLFKGPPVHERAHGLPHRGTTLRGCCHFILFCFSSLSKKELIYLGILNIIKDLWHQEIFNCEVPVQACGSPHPSINWQSVNVTQHKFLQTCMFLPA